MGTGSGEEERKRKAEVEEKALTFPSHALLHRLSGRGLGDGRGNLPFVFHLYNLFGAEPPMDEYVRRAPPAD